LLGRLRVNEGFALVSASSATAFEEEAVAWEEACAEEASAGGETMGVLLALAEDAAGVLSPPATGAATQPAPVAGVASAGPDWIGLQPGRVWRTGEASVLEVPVTEHC
jgi:hypothetical protein